MRRPAAVLCAVLFGSALGALSAFGLAQPPQLRSRVTLGEVSPACRRELGRFEETVDADLARNRAPRLKAAVRACAVSDDTTLVRAAQYLPYGKALVFMRAATLGD
jgi:hypothetical protein